MNIYIDIDGVLLHDSLEKNGQPVNHALELLREATTKHNCFWLTTHCRGGENHVAEYLGKRFPESKIYLNKIQPTNWNTWKTEAIDFSQDFRWLDDDVYEEEYRVLSKHDCRDKLILVDLRTNPDQLKEIYM
jgi:hypothetical protein